MRTAHGQGDEWRRFVAALRAQVAAGRESGGARPALEVLERLEAKYLAEMENELQKARDLRGPS
jgi:hypothetical protein